MPAQTPSASDFTNTVKNSAIVSASVGASAMKPKSSSSVPLVSVSSISSIVTRSKVSVSSGLQPASVRKFDSVASAPKTWKWETKDGPLSPYRVVMGGSNGEYIFLYGYGNSYYSKNGGTTWTNVTHSNSYFLRDTMNYAMSRNGKWVAIPLVGMVNSAYSTSGISTINLDTGTVYTLPNIGGWSAYSIGIVYVSIDNNGNVYYKKFQINTIYKHLFNGTAYDTNPTSFVADDGFIAIHDDSTKVRSFANYYNGSTFTSVASPSGGIGSYASASDLSLIVCVNNSISPVIQTYSSSTWSSWRTDSTMTLKNIFGVACSSDGKTIVLSCGWDYQPTSRCGFYVSQDSGTTWTFFNNTAPITAVAISRDGTKVYSIDSNYKLVIGTYS